MGSSERCSSSPVKRRFVGAAVLATLSTGVQTWVKEMRAGPGPVHVTLDCYPDDDEELVTTDHGIFTRTTVVVPLSSILSLELTERAPEPEPDSPPRQFGFTAPDDSQ